MSGCDTCRQPGACCMGFALTNNDGHITAWDSESRDQVNARAAGHGLPFRAIAKIDTTVDPASGQPYSSWYWGCPVLGADGRCTDYENRPQLCRTYQPGQDELCVEFKDIPIVVN